MHLFFHNPWILFDLFIDNYNCPVFSQLFGVRPMLSNEDNADRKHDKLSKHKELKFMVLVQFLGEQIQQM